MFLFISSLAKVDAIIVVAQLLSRVLLFVTMWAPACQVLLSFSTSLGVSIKIPTYKNNCSEPTQFISMLLDSKMTLS